MKIAKYLPPYVATKYGDKNQIPLDKDSQKDTYK